ncbi:DUF349 domain-containing protein [Prevotella salivae]|uniref:DUF349 domain-containing protein n=1 Tax=Segatella salivae TaxID=228604 RepID=A0AAW4NPW0_9BACT|nr:DUF349 domain-containing protein [Segatella salivae]MBW4865744.1 DUF349 domain-containing protein [Segatella salivae]MBW4909904.1 DUF349 domain-containing protein [Segatella salivae]
MMDSQENTLKEGTISEEQQVKETSVPVENTATTLASSKNYKSKAEIIERLKEIVGNDENPTKEELDHLKTSFYKLHIAEREAQQKAYLEAGGDPDKYVLVPDEAEDVFKAEMGVIKERRAKLFLQQEAEKQENLEKKLNIIERIKNMASSPEEANKNYNEFKELQQQWKDIKNVPADKANELWRNYQLYVEQYYDQLNLNREAREYDFKKNLGIKNHLCEAAEKLAEEPDVISAFHQLQELHQQFREVGPVAKELRDEVWTRFKAASTIINKRHQQHFDELRAKEEDNLVKKTALCEKVEDIVKDEHKGANEWEKLTKEIIDIQAEWKKIGFAPQKMNVKIFERFRAACDDFFSKKAAFFKEMKQRYNENIAKKQSLIEKAEALMESTDWKVTTDKMIALQKEWKTIGAVPKKAGDELWSKFLEACNKFFEARNAANAGTRNEERTNLDKKKAIISQLKELVEGSVDDLQEKVKELVDEYAKIGHVPYKEKDKLYKQYHEVLDKLYDDLHVTTAKRKLDNFKSNLKNVVKRGEDALDNERGRLMRRYEGLKQEINTYENNLGFLNASSKKGNSLIDEMNRKVQRLKDDMELIKQKIKTIDSENK